MKFFKYIIIAIASMVALVSCEKHDLGYQMEHIDTSEKALVVIWRLIPEASTTGARVYTITIDDQPLWGNNYTYMDARGCKPNQSRHYILEPGDHNMKWYLLDGTCVYDQNFTAIAGMQEVVVSDYNAAPIVVDNNAEYPQDIDKKLSDKLDLTQVDAASLAKEAGVVMTGAAATFPYHKDPKDNNMRIAPSFPPVDELETGMYVLCTCVKLACVEALLAK